MEQKPATRVSQCARGDSAEAQQIPSGVPTPVPKRVRPARPKSAPGHEDELVGGGARLGVDLDVEDGVPAVAVGQLRAERLEVLSLLALGLDLDELIVVGDPEDQVLQTKKKDARDAQMR